MDKPSQTCAVLNILDVLQPVLCFLTSFGMVTLNKKLRNNYLLKVVDANVLDLEALHMFTVPASTFLTFLPSFSASPGAIL